MKELEMQKTFELTNMREGVEVMIAQLKREEGNSKDMLDLKITAEQELELTTEDYEAKLKVKEQNQEDLAKLKLKLDQLRSQKKTLTKEKEELDVENAQLKKENEKYEADNEKLAGDISELKQRIEISSLLKKIDLDEMLHLHN